MLDFHRVIPSFRFKNLTLNKTLFLNKNVYCSLLKVFKLIEIEETMNNLRKTLSGLVLSGALLISGCSGGGGSSIFSSSTSWIPRYETKDLAGYEVAETPYKDALIKRAESISRDYSNLTKDEINDKKMAVAEIYGELCELEKMDSILNEVIKDAKTNEIAFKSAVIGKKYHERCEAKK